jgi:hypothetical protein
VDRAEPQRERERRLARLTRSSPLSSVAAAGTGVERGYGWLAAVVPADARRFRVADAALAAVLCETGAELVEARPDVEVAPLAALRGDAGLSLALLGRPAAGRPLPLGLGRFRSELPLPLRAARRLAGSFRVRLSVIGARRAVARLGYPDVRALLWDDQMAPHAGSGAGGRLRSSVRERLPQRALVIGADRPAGRTVLDDAVSAARSATGLALADAPASVRDGLLLVDLGEGMLRVALGPARRQIRAQRAALARLHDGKAEAAVVGRVPRELASGTTGIAEWSLETKLAGARPPLPLSRALLADCVEFLAALPVTGAAGREHGAFFEQARVVAAASPRHGRELRSIAEQLEAALCDLPRSFAHGDFFHGNLLVDGERLVGVVDWDAAGPGRLPLVDLLHLRLTSIRELSDVDWGPMLVRHLLPLADAGGDDLVRCYSRQTGLTVDPRRLRALVLAYWLDYVSYQLRTRPYNAARPRWVERNVERVVPALAGDGGRC